MTLDTKELFVEFETEVAGVGELVGEGALGGLVCDVGATGAGLVILATERRPEVSCAIAKFAPINRLIKRSIRGYMAKS